MTAFQFFGDYLDVQKGYSRFQAGKFIWCFNSFTTPRATCPKAVFFIFISNLWNLKDKETMPLTTSWRLFGSTPPLSASIAGNDGTEALILSNGKFNFERGLTVKRSLLLSLKNKGSPKVSGSNLCKYDSDRFASWRMTRFCTHHSHMMRMMMMMMVMMTTMTTTIMIFSMLEINYSCACYCTCF